MNNIKVKEILKFSLYKNIQNKWFIIFNIITLISTVIMLNWESIGNLFRYFRKSIYEEHLKRLIELYDKKPQIARMRKYFDKPVYYYHYDNKTWVVSKPFITTKNEKSMNKKAVAEFKINCSRIARRLFLNQRANYLEHHIAEIIWRLNNPNQEELVNYIYQTVKI